jgi:hypothetical protein
MISRFSCQAELEGHPLNSKTSHPWESKKIQVSVSNHSTTREIIQIPRRWNSYCDSRLEPRAPQRLCQVVPTGGSEIPSARPATAAPTHCRCCCWLPHVQRHPPRRRRPDPLQRRLLAASRPAPPAPPPLPRSTAAAAVGGRKSQIKHRAKNK